MGEKHYQSGVKRVNVPVVVRTIYTSARPLSNSLDKPRAVAVIFYFNSISSSYHVITSTFLKYRTRSVKQDLLVSKSFRVQIRVQTSGILTRYIDRRGMVVVTKV